MSLLNGVCSCPTAKPYYSLGHCISCYLPKYFNHTVNLCLSCNPGYRFNTQIRNCEKIICAFDRVLDINLSKCVCQTNKPY